MDKENIMFFEACHRDFVCNKLSLRLGFIGYVNTGTKEYLFVSVDITAAHDGSAA